MTALIYTLIGLQFVALFFVAMYLGFTMDNLDVAVKTIRSLEDSLSALSMAHDETVQATRATDDRFVELAEKIENIDEEVLNVDRKFSEFDERIEEIETKLETIGSTFRSLGTDLE